MVDSSMCISEKYHNYETIHIIQNLNVFAYTSTYMLRIYIYTVYVYSHIFCEMVQGNDAKQLHLTFLRLQL